MPDRGYPLAGSAAILCTGGLDVTRQEAWPFYRTISGVRLCWELEEPKGPKGPKGFTAIREEAGLFCGSFLRKGGVFNGTF